FAANGPIIRSTDSGSNWTQLSLTANTSRLASSGPYLFAGTDSGVYVSLDSGNTWRQENDGLGKYYQVNSLCVFDTLLFVNTALGFPYYTAMRPIREMVDTTKSAVAAGPVPQDTLSIYPNPATGLVTIFAGTIPIERVSVLNLLGVGVLNSPNPHTSELTLDLSELPSGTYILQIMTAKGTILRKVIRE
ncbi:MAG: T9SS type A sorting domain-containing protein, partial [Bacteroidota bacterium]|nr:T9SS type A sorting domain-containing protein [Bacteroidota bacterium]MDP4233467.1 T9SS type A sorting domain-containing protein [Bacteroidota bacterium]MDP4242333.1 T9SS type A sorting domain-containing protein [Bacteroidota bacterium]MDP4287089.1 T9SS type A sorting domain-containing protein [Bacteroidota bacterium]